MLRVSIFMLRVFIFMLTNVIVAGLYWKSGGSSAHTDLTHLRTHILLALAPHLRTQI